MNSFGFVGLACMDGVQIYHTRETAFASSDGSQNVVVTTSVQIYHTSHISYSSGMIRMREVDIE